MKKLTFKQSRELWVKNLGYSKLTKEELKKEIASFNKKAWGDRKNFSNKFPTNELTKYEELHKELKRRK